MLYAFRDQSTDDLGIRVGSSIDVVTDQGSATGDPGAGGTTGGSGDHDGPSDDPDDPGLSLVPDVGTPASPPGEDGTAIPGDPDADRPDDPTQTTLPPDSTPPTAPPTAVDLMVDGVTVPSTSEPTSDACGEPVAFDASRLVDGADATAWRMDGDGTGKTLTLTFEGTRRVLSVGLIPGFDHVDPCDGTDRFAQNRRISQVTWEFDDGTRVTQDLIDLATMQRIDVDATTRKIVLHIDGVTADPERNFTPISEIAVRGV